MKIVDSTTLIAFLSEMNCPDGIIKLSESYEIIIPEGVVNEIKKPPGKEMLQQLIKQGAVRKVNVDQQKVHQILADYPQLHVGESEVIVFRQMYSGRERCCIVTDDRQVRKTFKEFNFKWTEEILGMMKKKGIINNKVYVSKTNKLNKSKFFSR